MADLDSLPYQDYACVAVLPRHHAPKDGGASPANLPVVAPALHVSPLGQRCLVSTLLPFCWSVMVVSRSLRQSGWGRRVPWAYGFAKAGCGLTKERSERRM